MTTQPTRPDNERWEKFCGSRLGYLTSLADVVEQAFIRRDTQHPAFCGCIDWHSSVHGAYALLTAARLTTRHRWAEVVDESLTTKCLDAELEALTKGNLDQELPYGYAWFLKLAIEREQWWGKTDLLPLATEIALQLGRWVFSLSDEAVIHHVERREYGNLSWAVLNLWEWSQWKGDFELGDKLCQFTRTRMVSLDEVFPSSLDHISDEFFAASLQRTRTILAVLPKQESLEWFKNFSSTEMSLKPIRHAHTPHSAGLNFSRAWAFWSLFAHTGNEFYRKHYVDHIVTHMNQPQCWRDDYRKHAHWVPQFGIYAIAKSLNNAAY